ncbi:MAG: RpiB/LacA/LacB family sugar-phosphate isomerase [Patescibacteria group bacterium]
MEDQQKHILLATDHAGFKLKNIIQEMLENELGYAVEDVGATEFDEQDDYPDFGAALAKRVLETGWPGIAFCGSGIGICAVLNKYKGILAGTGFNLQAAEAMKRDEDTNVLCLAGRMIGEDYAKAIVRKWLETPFSGEARHVQRLEKIKKIEGKNMV